MNSLEDLQRFAAEIIKEAWDNGAKAGNEQEPLKPCPFCGGKPVVSVIKPTTGVVEAWRIYCECGANTKWAKSKKEAIEDWNRRA